MEWRGGPYLWTAPITPGSSGGERRAGASRSMGVSANTWWAPAASGCHSWRTGTAPPPSATTSRMGSWPWPWGDSGSRTPGCTSAERSTWGKPTPYRGCKWMCWQVGPGALSFTSSYLNFTSLQMPGLYFSKHLLLSVSKEVPSLFLFPNL